MRGENKPKPARFSVNDAQHAADEWGANCGPGAIAGVLDMTLDEVRPHMGNFEQKGYTNPLLMFGVLRSLGIRWTCLGLPASGLPRNGLVRVQWEGPWTAPGVPMRVRYRHTHWIATRWTRQATWVFDINCICVGGWVHLEEWRDQVVPWLLKQVEPKANGAFHFTHALELQQ